MLLSRIQALLNHTLSVKDFKQEILDEIREYEQAHLKKESNIPIYLDDDISQLSLDEDNLKFLCDQYLSARLNKWEINYIVEAIFLSENIVFCSEEIEDAFFSLADPSYFDLIDDEYIKSILNSIDN